MLAVYAALIVVGLLSSNGRKSAAPKLDTRWLTTTGTQGSTGAVATAPARAKTQLSTRPADARPVSRSAATAPETATAYSTPPAYSRYYDYDYRPAVGYHFVNGYYRWDGTYVIGHFRTNPDDSFWNNWSSYGNVNPYTGRVGTKRPPGWSSYSSHVSGHHRGR
jgi:hypothetical protein